MLREIISFQVKARHKNEKFKKQAKLGQNQVAPVPDEEDTKIESFDKKRGQSRRVTPIIIVSSCWGVWKSKAIQEKAKTLRKAYTYFNLDQVSWFDEFFIIFAKIGFT